MKATNEMNILEKLFFKAVNFYSQIYTGFWLKNNKFVKELQIYDTAGRTA